MAVEDEGTLSQAEQLHRGLFGRIGVNQAQRVLAVLLEAPFFYKSDDPDLFGVLLRNRSAFADFFHVCFDWDLHVEPRMARVVRRSGVNSALSSRERHLFSLSGRDEQVLFILLLEFQEMEADRQNVDWSQHDMLRFVLQDFVNHVFTRYHEAMKMDGRLESRILTAAKDLFRKLDEYRMLRRVEGTRGLVIFT
ncbi:DUF2398 family protein [Candidatus Sumerlaeota bacterium]|nr:DUF2398 family protein [Candidatus Sumerlaeota bacterium]